MSEAIITAEHAAAIEAQKQLIKDVFFKGASDVEVQFCTEVAKQYGFSPFKRQIHFMKRWDSALGKNVITPVVGIDGFRVQAARSEVYAGSDDAIFELNPDNPKLPHRATVTVWKIVHGQRVPFTASALYDESVQFTRNQETKEWVVNSMWRKRPFGQLSKCAESAALRKAFPESMSGLFTDAEMTDTDDEPERNVGVLRPANSPAEDGRHSAQPAERTSSPVVEAESENAASGESGARQRVSDSKGQSARSPKADPGDASPPAESNFERAMRTCADAVIPEGFPHAGMRLRQLPSKVRHEFLTADIEYPPEFDLCVRAAIVVRLETECGKENTALETYAFQCPLPDGKDWGDLTRGELLAVAKDIQHWLQK